MERQNHYMLLISKDEDLEPTLSYARRTRGSIKHPKIRYEPDQTEAPDHGPARPNVRQAPDQTNLNM